MGSGYVAGLVDGHVDSLIREVVDTENNTESASRWDGVMRWYVVNTTTGHEKLVMNSLNERLRDSDLCDQFGKIMVPVEEIMEVRSGVKRKSERKFFPGYVLVQMVMNDDTWRLVRDVPRVRGFVGGFPNKPEPIREKEMTRVLQGVRDSVDEPKPKILFETGEMVRVTNGPFNDFNAIVEEVHYDKSKVQVSVQIFGRSTPVELDFTQIDKA